MEGDEIEIIQEGCQTRLQLRGKHVIEIPFVHQCYSWDCGLACVSMILKMFSEPCDDVYTKDLDSMQCGENIWTIDLAYILNRHNVHSCLYTKTLGAHPDHAKKLFYKKSFTEDSLRIKSMFEKAGQQGVLVKKRSLRIDEMLLHVQDNNPIIVLVDWTLMGCVWCDNKFKKCWSCLTCQQGPYQGHYVILCGFDRSRSLIFFKNPDTSSADMCAIEIDQFDKARKSDGTDEDTLFIYRRTFPVDVCSNLPIATSSAESEPS